ncbi:MAG: galactose mutarotase [Clostridia bacterium]|nr:galactose mutarotase [Clostridia bacterium]
MTEITKSLFGTTKDGRSVYAFTLKDGAYSATVLDYGGIILNIIVPDKNGNPTDVLIGYDDVAGFENNGGYLNALIGRFGNRIDKGSLTIDGTEYKLYINDRSNHLHGGKVGFDKKTWASEIDGEKLVLSLLSPDGEENYPGNLEVKVVYTMKNGVLGIEYTAVSDKKTAINLTNHAYFNLSGDGKTILDHELMLDAPYIAATDGELIPHGEFRAVKGTPFDFTSPKTVGEGDKYLESDPDLQIGGGFDHCFVFDKNRDKTAPYGVLYSPVSGIEMKCYTNMPAVQLYAGNGLSQVGKMGVKYGRCGALCLETQAIPNNVNVPEYAAYGSSIYAAGEVYHFSAQYAFSVRK